MRPNAVKRALKAKQPSVGTWLSLGNVPAARFMARTGFHWLTVDIEHSMVGIETAASIFGAIADAGCVALARVPANRHDHIKRVLDNGAQGVVVPMVNSRAEAEAAVAAMLYPPRGNRSVGGSVHALNFGGTAPEYYARADDELLIVLQCEHIQAVEHADEIFSVPGIDAIFVGPNDLAASLRDAKGTPPSKQLMEDTLTRIREAAQRCKVPCGIHVQTYEAAKRRIDEGWQFIAVASELKFMLSGAAAEMEKITAVATAKPEMAKY